LEETARLQDVREVQEQRLVGHEQFANQHQAE